MADIKFRDTAHRDFFLENMMKCRVNDCYHRAFFYVMGIASETRANINQIHRYHECISTASRNVKNLLQRKMSRSIITKILQKPCSGVHF